MSLHHYPCPNCAAVLQSPRDVSGLPVRCLGCNAVFTAGGKPLPSPPPPKPRPAPTAEKPTRKARPRNEEPTPRLPDIPRSGRFRGVAVFTVVVLALGAAGGITFAIARNKASKVSEQKVVQSPPAEIPQTPPTKKPVVEPEPEPVAPPPTRARLEEEEDLTTVPKVPPPTKDPEKEKTKPTGPTLPNPNTPTLIFPEAKTPPKPEPVTKPAPKREEPSARPEPPPEKVPEPVRTPAKAPPIEVAPTTDGQIPKPLLDALKAATVYVRVMADRRGVSGSGFVLKVDGDTALIVTNDHVAVPRGKELAGPAVRFEHELVFYSGRRNEFIRKAELIATDGVRDLAILRVRGIKGVADFPAPLSTDKAPLSETMPVFIMGFPFGSDLATGRANPALTIGKGTISSLREDDNGELDTIQLNGDVNPGNSGGPVVDSRGRLVGIAVASIDATQIGMAIPAAELTKMLAGRIGKVVPTIRQHEGAAVLVDLHAEVADPFQKITKVAVHYTRIDGLRAKPKPGKDGAWGPLPGSARAELKVNGIDAHGSIRLGSNDVGAVPMVFQAEWSVGGKPVYGEPQIHLWVDPRTGAPRPGNERPPPGTGVPTPPPAPVRPPPPGGTVPMPGNPGIGIPGPPAGTVPVPGVPGFGPPGRPKGK
jgi:S1-C subfamily serine protease